MRETGSRLEDRPYERSRERKGHPAGPIEWACAWSPRRRGAARCRATVGRLRLSDRLTGRPSYTPIRTNHASPNISQTLAFDPLAARARTFSSSSSSLCALMTATRGPVSRAVQACTGVGFMFAELVGNSCRLTYSYCPARCNSPRRLRRVCRIHAAAALPAFSQWWIYSC